MRWRDRDGVLWLWPLLPAQRQILISGGPGEKQTVLEGVQAGQLYLGSDGDGFERLVRPAGHARPANAWYRLGEPTLLGPAFGDTPTWGRVEIEPPDGGKSHLFVNVFVIEAAGATRPPSAAVTQTVENVSVEVDTGIGRLLVRIPAGSALGGTGGVPRRRVDAVAASH